MAGRPLKFKTVEELQKKIDAYFDSCWEEREEKDGNGDVFKRYKVQITPYTITGLALALDTTRETLMDYEEKDGYSDTIKMAKLRCQNFAEQQLFTGKNAAGPIFALKNYGWRDKIENELTGKDGKDLIPENTNLDKLAELISKKNKEVYEGED